MNVISGRYRLLMICKLSFVDDLSAMKPRLDLCVYLDARAPFYIYPYPATSRRSTAGLLPATAGA